MLIIDRTHLQETCAGMSVRAHAAISGGIVRGNRGMLADYTGNAEPMPERFDAPLQAAARLLDWVSTAQGDECPVTADEAEAGHVR
jgi:hypothetical protein